MLFAVMGKGKTVYLCTRVKTSIQGWNGGKGVAEQPLKKTICKFWLEASRENYQLNINDQLHIILKLQVQQS